jgi:hypothetical protein
VKVIAFIDGSTEEAINKVALVGLSILTMGLNEQGLGLRDVCDHNAALLGIGGGSQDIHILTR